GSQLLPVLVGGDRLDRVGAAHEHGRPARQAGRQVPGRRGLSAPVHRQGDQGSRGEERRRPRTARENLPEAVRPPQGGHGGGRGKIRADPERRFYFRLALEKGMSVAELLRTHTSAELTQWMAY